MLRGIKFISSTIDAKSRPWCRLSISTTEFNVQRDNNCCMVAVKLGAAMQSEICIEVSQEGESVPFLSITSVLLFIGVLDIINRLIGWRVYACAWFLSCMYKICSRPRYLRPLIMKWASNTQPLNDKPYFKAFVTVRYRTKISVCTVPQGPLFKIHTCTSDNLESRFGASKSAIFYVNGRGISCLSCIWH